MDKSQTLTLLSNIREFLREERDDAQYRVTTALEFCHTAPPSAKRKADRLNILLDDLAMVIVENNFSQ